MKDAIDKRNEIQRIAKSIVKRSSVNYITKEEAEKLRLEAEEEERLNLKLEEEHRKAQEVLNRLEAEAREDEEQKEREIRELMTQQEEEPVTNHASYGEMPMDDVTQDRVEAILSAKTRKIEELFQEAANLDND